MFTVKTISGFEMILEDAGQDADGCQLWRQVKVGIKPADSVLRSGGQTKQFGPRPRIAVTRPKTADPDGFAYDDDLLSYAEQHGHREEGARQGSAEEGRGESRVQEEQPQHRVRRAAE